MKDQLNFLAEYVRLEKINALRDSVTKLNIIDWEVFRPTIEGAFDDDQRIGMVGRPPYDHVFLFKLLALQKIFSFSDEDIIISANDSVSIMNFLNINIEDGVPATSTLSKFRSWLNDRGVLQDLFMQLDIQLEKQNIEIKIIKNITIEVANYPEK